MLETIGTIAYLLLLCSILALVLIFLWRVFFGKSKDEHEAEDEHVPNGGSQAASDHHTENEVVDDKKSGSGVWSGAEFVEALDGLGYFKFTAPEDLGAAKRMLAQHFEEGYGIGMIMDESDATELTHRCYPCDVDLTFEPAGLAMYLEALKPVFGKLDIPMQWSDYVRDEDVPSLMIHLNGSLYEVARGNLENSSTCAEFFMNFSIMINDQFELNGSDERVYLGGDGTDEFLYVLTPKQREFLLRRTSPEYVPLPIFQWWEKRKAWKSPAYPFSPLRELLLAQWFKANHGESQAPD